MLIALRSTERSCNSARSLLELRQQMRNLLQRGSASTSNSLPMLHMPLCRRRHVYIQPNQFTYTLPCVGMRR